MKPYDGSTSIPSLSNEEDTKMDTTSQHGLCLSLRNWKLKRPKTKIKSMNYSRQTPDQKIKTIEKKDLWMLLKTIKMYKPQIQRTRKFTKYS